MMGRCYLPFFVAALVTLPARLRFPAGSIERQIAKAWV